MAPAYLAFDLYGTLLSTEAVAEELSKHVDQDKAKEVATLWRRCQLEYTWRSNSMNQFVSFSDITRRALRHALNETSSELQSEVVDQLMAVYADLPFFPDVEAGLQVLSRSMPENDIYPVIFTNGTYGMVPSRFKAMCKDSSEDGVSGACAFPPFQKIITVDRVQKYKPASEVYHHLVGTVAASTNTTSPMHNWWLVSANPFDIAGAHAVGIKTCWVDRARKGWMDALLGDVKPDVIAHDIQEVARFFTQKQNLDSAPSYRNTMA